MAVAVGSVDLGVLDYSGSPGGCYSSNGDREHFYSVSYESAEVSISFVGLTLSAQSGSLSASYTSSWTQGWAYTSNGPGPVFNGDSYETADTTLTYTGNAAVTVQQPSSCVVTFPWTGAPDCTSELNSNLLWGFGQVDSGSLVEQDVESTLAPMFTKIDTISGLDTYALQNILFYPNQTLSLSQGLLPGDLLLVGQTVPPLAISPQGPIRIGISSQGSQQLVAFTASYDGNTTSDVIWEM